MAENGAERDENRDPEDPGVPFDESAAWEAIVAGYGSEPPDPPGAKPFKSVEDLARLEAESNGPTDRRAPEESGGTDTLDRDKPLGGSVAFAPGIGGGPEPGPRDYRLPEDAPAGADAGAEDDDEGHFVPPEPPPLPEVDTTARFAWLAVIGGPVLLLLAVLLGWEMTWWLTTLGIGGFLGGFATLVGRMKHDEDEDDDPGRGAVV